VPPRALVFFAISAICLVLAFTAEAFYHRLTGQEIPIRIGRSILLAVSIVFLVLAIIDLLAP